MGNNWQQQKWSDRSDIEDRHCCPWNSAIRRVSPRYFDCLVSDRFYRAIKVLIDQQNVSNGKCTRAHALNFFLSDLSRMYTFDTIFDARLIAMEREIGETDIRWPRSFRVCILNGLNENRKGKPHSIRTMITVNAARTNKAIPPPPPPLRIIRLFLLVKHTLYVGFSRVHFHVLNMIIFDERDSSRFVLRGHTV